MLSIGNSYSRGDTLIEVLLALSVFSLVAVGGMTVMNQGAATSQRALEITLVRQEMGAQVEALRLMNSSYVTAHATGVYASGTPAAEWKKMEDGIIANNASSASNFETGAACPADRPNGSFIINTRKALYTPKSDNKMVPASTFSQVVYDGSNNMSDAEGIWIEAVRSGSSADVNQADSGYIDFYVRSCWDSPGQSSTVTLQDLVRLYEPR